MNASTGLPSLADALARIDARNRSTVPASTGLPSLADALARIDARNRSTVPASTEPPSLADALARIDARNRSTVPASTGLPSLADVLARIDARNRSTVTVTTRLPSDSLAKLGKVLGQDKAAFLEDIERSIYTYIVGTGRQCIAVVQKIPKEGSTNADPPSSRYYLNKYELNMNDLGDFVVVLYKFMRGQKHEGYELDSALTVPILEIIEKKFVALYEAHGQEISEELLRALRNDNILLESFVSRLSDTLSSKISKKAQKEIVNLLAHQTHDAVSSSTAHVVGHQIAHLSATAVGSQVTLMAAKVLVHSLAANISHIVTIFLANAAFKKVLYALIHKMLYGVIVGTVLKFLAVTFGASVGAGALSFILLPIMAAVIYAQVKGFPSKLGREVSKSVRDRLDLEFEGMNREILKDTFQKILQGKDLLDAVAANKDVKEMFLAMGKAFC